MRRCLEENMDVVLMERKAANGYRLDAMTPTQACVKDGETTTVEITNQRMCSIMIHKVDANTGKGLYGLRTWI